MKRVSFILLVFSLAVAIFGNVCFAVAADKNNQLASRWPDYSEWPIIDKAPISAFINNTDLNNDYIDKLYVLIGTRTIRLDNAEKPIASIIEFDILGNGPTIRKLFTATAGSAMLVDSQILMDGKWISYKDKTLKVYLVNPEKFLKEGELEELILIAEPLEPAYPLLRLRVINEQKRR
jgi:hypothetical protein